MLAYLVEDGFVVSTGDGNFGYNYDRARVYLPDDSVLTRLNHTNWRTLALTRPDQTPEDLHYSSISAISRDDYPRFRQMLMDFIEEHRQQVADSGCEELMVFSCDMFSL